MRRFFNHPAVVVILFLITVGLIVWAFLPASTETLYREGSTRMQSSNTDEWDRGWELLGEMEQKDPNHPHKAEVEAFRKQYDELLVRRRTEKLAKGIRAPGEAEFFYQQGLRLRQQGREDEARKVWRTLADAFREVKTEDAWVKLAEDALGQPVEAVPPTERRLEPVDAAVAEARRLREAGKPDDADKIERALEKLYGDDPEVRKRLKK